MNEEPIMAKTQDSKKSTKKEPAIKGVKAQRAAKQAKKDKK